MRKKTLYLVHHSHTDIGYTHSQERIKQYHVDFILQVLDTFDRIDAGYKAWEGYHYTCENFWQVETFYEHASLEDQKRFEDRVKSGHIEISLSYLNMNDMADVYQLRDKFAKAQRYLKDLNVHGESAMTADINGVSWGYAQAMFDNGVRNYFSNVHTHHGMFPIFRKQIPFYWETQKGDRLLVWNGDHYQVGNTFFLTPNSDFGSVFPNGYGQAEADAQFAKTEAKIFAHFENLEREGYPYDFVPEMISGVVTDNSAPNPRMMEIIKRWNDTHGDTIEIVLTSLDHFFTTLRASDIEIPVYRGDWPDWWADGAGSTPAFVKLYREAQRLYRLSLKLDPSQTLGKKDSLTSAENNMLMYAEHTWGHAASISDPWESGVNETDYKKSAYAINAHSDITKHMIAILANKGEISPTLDRQKLFKIVNPHPYALSNYAKVGIDHWEHVDGSYFHLHNKDRIELVDMEGNVIASQMERTTRGYSLEFLANLKPHEELMVRVRQVPHYQAPYTNNNFAIRATDHVCDIADYEGYTNTLNFHNASTKFFDIRFDDNGIASIIDKRTGEQLVKEDSVFNAFQGIVDVTDMHLDPANARRILGRNRKGRAARQYQAHLTNMTILDDGPVFATYSMEYALQGTLRFEMVLKVYKESPLLRVNIRIMKQFEWRPENMYIALPFQHGKTYEMFADKAGVTYRPSIDQLPGTNTDFFMTQVGLHYRGQKGCMTLISRDTPFIWLGDLKHHQIELYNESCKDKNQHPAYSWPLNNFWETNFKADTSGSYDFEYMLYMGDDRDDVDTAMDVASCINEGFVTFATQ